MAISDYEQALIKKAVSGDEASFEALIFSCKGKAYNIAFRYLRNQEDAMDALQESFIKIFRHLGKFNGESSFDTWVYRIVVNTCNDMLKKSKKRTEPLAFYNQKEESHQWEIPDTELLPDERLIQKEKSTYILDCLEKIPIEQKEILILRDIQGFSYEEIAVILKANVGTVKSRLSRARLKLREVYIREQK